MAVGDTQRAFAESARRDGIELIPQSVNWLTQRGHLGLPDPGTKRTTVDVLESIYLALGGDLPTLAAAKTTPLRGDFLHPATGTLIEIDESQHFTTQRLKSLQMYPPSVALGFDMARYMQLCTVWAHKSDNYFRTKSARGFGTGGRQRQRAYYDALRDLATPAMNHPPLVRIDAADRNPADAHHRHRDQLAAALLK